MINTRLIDYKLPAQSLLFLCNSNQLIIRGNLGFILLQLPSYYFYRILGKERFSIMFTSLFFFRSFLHHLSYLLNRLTIIFFLKLKLKGLGYRIKKYGRFLYRFFFTRTNYIYFHVPKEVLIKSKKRRIILLSNNMHLVREVFVHLLLLKKVGPYNKRGFTFPRRIILLKPGKKII